MTLDNMTGITKGSYTGDDLFCKSQLITCNRVKECNGVCPFEDALKHADKEMDEQTVIDHDRDWIIGCIKHDGFIKTDRFDKANQIILEALDSTEPSDLISRADVLGYIDRLDTCGLGKGKALEYIRKYVEKTDSVSAERVGEWTARKTSLEFVCSQCGEACWKDFHYCPHCGAKMENTK